MMITILLLALAAIVTSPLSTTFAQNDFESSSPPPPPPPPPSPSSNVLLQETLAQIMAELALLKNSLQELKMQQQQSSSCQQQQHHHSTHYHHHYHGVRPPPPWPTPEVLPKPVPAGIPPAAPLADPTVELKKAQGQFTAIAFQPTLLSSAAVPNGDAIMTAAANHSNKFPPINLTEAVAAACHMKPNRHIALLNQQDIQGHVSMWQSKQDPEQSTEPAPLYVRIRLRGFKTAPENETINGTVTTTGTETNTATVSAYGIHVHDGNDLTYGCQSVGNHYNPHNVSHGAPTDPVKHVGDLGNIITDQTGRVHQDLVFQHVGLTGPYSILNRTIVIRNGPDGGKKSTATTSAVPVTTGNGATSSGGGGVRIACCVIRQVPIRR